MIIALTLALIALPLTARDVEAQDTVTGCGELNKTVMNEMAIGNISEAERALSGTPPACAGLVLNNLAVQKQISGQLAEVERYAQRAIHALESAYAQDDPALFRPLQVLAAARFERGDLGKAREAFKRMQSVRIEWAGDRALLDAMSAALLTSEGRYREAELEYLAALRAWDEAGRANTPYAATTLTALGSLYSEQNRLDDAARVLEQALRIIDSSSDAVPIHRLLVLCARGVMHARQQQWRGAEQELRNAVSTAELLPGLDPLVFSRVLTNYSFVLRKNRHKREARSAEMRAVALHAYPVPVVDAAELSAKRKGHKE